jgi:hypothetical protein
MEFHELSNIFPMMSESEFAALAVDIQEHGLREAIWTHDEKIIDGRNRFKACEKLSLKPVFRKWDGKGSLVSFVVSLNLHRRHLNESQRAMVAAKIASLPKGANQHAPIGATSQDGAAEMLNVSPRSVTRAKAVQESGDASLIADVESGEVTVSAAAKHVAAVTRYPELRNISREKDVLTVAKNLDALSEDERNVARSKLMKNDQNMLALLAEKPPMPRAAPKRKKTPAEAWQDKLVEMNNFFTSVKKLGGGQVLTANWTKAQRDYFLAGITTYRNAADEILSQIKEHTHANRQKAIA